MIKKIKTTVTTNISSKMNNKDSNKNYIIIIRNHNSTRRVSPSVGAVKRFCRVSLKLDLSS